MIEFIQQNGRDNLVIFIHGFTGGKETWINSNQISFPDMLLEDERIKENFDFAYITYYSKLFSNFKIGYGKSILLKLFKNQWQRVPQNIDILELGEYVRSLIKYNCEQYKNIIIIAHSMGGLIAKACILKEIKQNPYSKVKLLISLAVPHKGSNWANIGRALFKNKQIIDLGPLSTTLDYLNNNWIKQRSQLPKTVYFYGEYDIIVPKTSAIGYEVEEQLTVPCQDDHFSISKPESTNALSFVGVKRHLIEFIEQKRYFDVLEIYKDPVEFLNNNIILEYEGYAPLKDKFVVKYNKKDVGRIDGPETTTLRFKLWNKSNIELIINQITMQNVVPFHFSSKYWKPLPSKGFSEDNVLYELLYKYRYVNNTTLGPNRYINIIYNFPLLLIEIAKKMIDFKYYFHIDLTIPGKSMDYKFQDITREITKEFYLELEYNES